MMKILRSIISKWISFGSKATTSLPDGKGVAAGISKGLQQVNFSGENKVATGCNFNGSITIGYASTLGYNGTYHGNIRVGNYCQLGPNVSIITSNHPMFHLSTYINDSLFDGELKQLKENKKVQIGNDVWVGQQVVILGGITIGNGAIIAAGSIVTKDVAPFSIVAGNPAKHIKFRFATALQEEIVALDWWNKNIKELEEIKPLFFKDLEDQQSLR